MSLVGEHPQVEPLLEARDGAQRARLLEAMTLAVGEKGYAAATVADAVRGARVSRGTFYALFESKEACFLEAYRHGIDVLVARLDDAVRADLECRDPTPEQCERLAGTDLVISTGCLGYVTERTVLRVARAAGDRPPWMAHFVLRMYPFEPVAEGLAALGYRTVRDDRYFRQRLFASPEEQAQVLDTLRDQGIDPSGWETDGWLYAQLFISSPVEP